MDNPEKALWIMKQLGDPSRLRMVYDYSHYIYTGLELVLTEQTAKKTAILQSKIPFVRRTESFDSNYQGRPERLISPR